MKKNWTLLFLLILFIIKSADIYAQLYSEKLNGYILPCEIYGTDTVPCVELRELPVYPTKFKDKKSEKFYWKTVRDVKKVYPYVKIVAEEYKAVNAKFDTITDKRERAKYTKKYEKQLLKKYEPVMRKFTLSQGKMMIKLIDRELDKSSYSLIKEIRGGFVAWWWQVFAKMCGADLKDDFDIENSEKDKIVERVITLYEAGLL